jgi:hypothetical protein
MMCAIASGTPSSRRSGASDGGRPARMLNNVEPSEYTSDATVAGRPARTSGARCRGLPTTPPLLPDRVSCSRAIPKSPSLG